MGTRVRSPSTTKARGPGETTRRHGPRHVRARASDEARGSVPGDRLGAGRGLAQGESRLPRGRSAPGSVTGQSGWKSGSRACAGAPTSETAKKAAAIRLPCVRRRVPPVTWEPLTSPAAPARGGASSDAAPSVHQPERLPRAVRVRLDAHRSVVVVGPVPHMRRPTQAIHLTHRSGPCLLPCGAPAWSRGRRREGPPCECGRRRIARIVSQGFHRLFGGECSGSSGYIVVAAGREDSRGLGSPMTEFLPRRPRVLGSPRSVALAKEGVPPEWEPGCGAPRRRRPVGRERQPGATGHVTSGRRSETQSS